MSGKQFANQNRLFMRAIWRMRVPALFICGPVFGVLMIDSFFGLPRHLWYVAGVFFLFSMGLFSLLVRGEIKRMRRMARPR